MKQQPERMTESIKEALEGHVSTHHDVAFFNPSPAGHCQGVLVPDESVVEPIFARSEPHPLNLALELHGDVEVQGDVKHIIPSIDFDISSDDNDLQPAIASAIELEFPPADDKDKIGIPTNPTSHRGDDKGKNTASWQGHEAVIQAPLGATQDGVEDSQEVKESVRVSVDPCARCGSFLCRYDHCHDQNERSDCKSYLGGGHERPCASSPFFPFEVKGRGQKVQSLGTREHEVHGSQHISRSMESPRAHVTPPNQGPKSLAIPLMSCAIDHRAASPPSLTGDGLFQPFIPFQPFNLSQPFTPPQPFNPFSPLDLDSSESWASPMSLSPDFDVLGLNDTSYIYGHDISISDENEHGAEQIPTGSAYDTFSPIPSPFRVDQRASDSDEYLIAQFPSGNANINLVTFEDNPMGQFSLPESIENVGFHQPEQHSPGSFSHEMVSNSQMGASWLGSASPSLLSLGPTQQNFLPLSFSASRGIAPTEEDSFLSFQPLRLLSRRHSDPTRAGGPEGNHKGRPNAHTVQCSHRSSPHTGRVQSVAYSPDGTRVASGSSDLSARVWGVSAGDPSGAGLAAGPEQTRLSSIQAGLCHRGVSRDQSTSFWLNHHRGGVFGGTMGTGTDIAAGSEIVVPVSHADARSPPLTSFVPPSTSFTPTTLQPVTSKLAVIAGEQRRQKAPSFTCPICPQTFTSNHNLKTHTSTHLGVKPHQCGSCSRGFTTRRILERHAKICKQAPSPTPIEPGQHSHVGNVR
ncbi:hypothetical protein BKA70DRAFT_1255278 [Coprinopsis sp. MPI-PUGE-AT-0042]|nr:hypothetical protein BKA70DRAFT_1255278 [Coprinopsis sp. MPI-PUGE-AT-0042]